MDPARKPATYDDLWALPEDVRAEVLGGEIIAQPSPLPRHSHVANALSHFVGGPFHFGDGCGGWWILADIGRLFPPR